MTPDLPESERTMTTEGLAAFHQIALELTSSVELKPILATIMAQIGHMFRPESSTLLLIDELDNNFYAAVAQVDHGGKLSSNHNSVPSGLAAAVAKSGEAIILPDVDSSKVLIAGVEHTLDSRIHSAACLPLLSRNKTVGVIQLLNLPARAFSEESICRLMVFSDFAAIAIENARSFERLQTLALIDECTGLHNLRHFEQVLPNEIARCQRFSTALSLIFVDLDQFKLVNDRHGHLVGNQLLAEVGATLKGLVRSIDLCFRYGGDEFVVLLPGTDKAAAIRVADRIVAALRKKSFSLSPLASVNISASCGLSSFPEDGATAQEVLSAADLRMYCVKERSGDAVCYEGRRMEIASVARSAPYDPLSVGPVTG